ncbi:hypothetical protein DL767_001694 [Monosporascus sp. MG133]|nr:hypothetical protein DL767_001694 [Monosporascus sp. MG133]
MASSAGTTRRVLRVALPALIPAVAYTAYKFDLARAIKAFFTGSGKYSRIAILTLLLWNWKSLPLAWTIRVWNAMIIHLYLRKSHSHTPDKLFHPVISKSRVTLLEVDYNIHKSNSTYFADLDVSRSHLVSHLLSRGLRITADNVNTKLVMDPADPSRPAKGKLGIMLGATGCSFKKEIKPYAKYEMWSRILAWDRKWLYILTHFVEKGAVRPKSWDEASFGPTRKGDGKPQDWEKKIHATAVSKYVFKIGRLTVHPAIIIGASGLLPERPGGWVTTENGMAKPAQPVTGGTLDEAGSTTWDWRRTDEELKKGLEYAKHFAALDEMHSLFDGGEDGALGIFGLG